MESFTLKLFILFVTFITNSKVNGQDCSYINSAPDFDLSRISGDWYTIMRWENGIDKNTICTKSVIKKNLDITKTNYFPKGKKENISGYFNTTASCKSTVILHWPPKIPCKVIVIYIDYDNVAIVQACYENTDYFWVYTREQYPCKDVLKKVDEVIKENQLDRHEIIRQ